MQGGVKMVGFSWDGSYIVGGSDEGNGLAIVSLTTPSAHGNPLCDVSRRSANSVSG